MIMMTSTLLLLLLLLLIRVPKLVFIMAQTEIDLAFVVDGSASIDAVDWELQKQGISLAILNPTLIPRDGSIAVTVIQFSTPTPLVEVPYTLIRSQSDIDSVVNAVLNMIQINGLTNAGEGIVAATIILSNSFRISANQSICMSTDGISNDGVDPGSALEAAKVAPFLLDTFGVIGIEDEYFTAPQYQMAYGPLVFGGGSLLFTRNSIEFANTVGSICFPKINTELVGLEIVQASQDLKNSVVLVEDKATLVRAYIQAEDPSKSGRIQARLHGRVRGGDELPNSPLTATISGGIVVKDKILDRRNVFEDSFNFILPFSWQSGTVELEIEGVGTDLKCREAAGPTPNDCKATAIFRATPALEVKLVQISYIDPAGTVKESSTSDLRALHSRLEAIYPVSSIDVSTGFLDMGLGVPDGIKVNSRLESMRVLDGCITSFGCNRLYHGVIDQGGDLTRGKDKATGGLANSIPGTASCAVMEDGDTYGRFRSAHEIAHTMGASHAVTVSATGGRVGLCGEKADASAPIFPYVETIDGFRRATIGPLSLGANDIVFGWDSFRNKVIDPKTNYELLSYCQERRWISPFTYSNLRAYITSTFRRRDLKGRTSRKLEGGYTVIRAIVDMDTMTTTFLPAFHVEFVFTQPIGSDGYEVVGRNGSGDEIFRVIFDPIKFSQDLPSQNGSVPVEINAIYVQAFIETPTTGMIKSVHVEKGGAAVGAAQSISSNAPTVTVMFPNGGESLSGVTTTITWKSSDPDGGTLSYVVQFSRDGGIDWKTLAMDHVGTSLTIPLNALGETQFGLIRVQASDGFNTGEDVSDGSFITPNILPEVQIWSPSNNIVGDDVVVFVGVELIVFQATCSDVEDGTIADSSLTWSSNIDGFLGLGQTFEILASELTDSNHTITLTCFDGDGAMVTDSLNITIYRLPPFNFTRTVPPTQSPKATCRIGFFYFFCLIKSVFKWLINIIF